MAQFKANIETLGDEAVGIRRLVIRPTEPFTFDAGQVVHLSVGETGGYFAIASAPSEGPELTLLVKVVGSGSEFAAGLSTGTEVSLEGPLGTGYPLDALTDDAADLLLIAAGTGIAPLRAAIIADRGRTRAGTTRLLYGVRHAHERCFRAELETWQRDGITLREVISQPLAETGWTGRVGRVQQHLDGLITEATTAFIAGPPAMEVDVIDALVALGVPRTRCWTNVDPDAFG